MSMGDVNENRAETTPLLQSPRTTRLPGRLGRSVEEVLKKLPAAKRAADLMG